MSEKGTFWLPVDFLVYQGRAAAQKVKPGGLARLFSLSPFGD